MPAVNWFCFCTEKYKKIAETNKANWDKFLGPVSLVEYPDQGSWELNCLKRPQLLYKQATFSGATGLIDADVIFRRRPELVLEPRAGADVSVRKTGDPCLSRYFSCGLLLFSPTQKGLQFLRMWSEKCMSNDFDKDIGLREQWAFYYAWEHAHANLNLLPSSYCFVPKSLSDPEPFDTVVYHLPYSRTLKDKKSLITLLPTGEITPAVTSAATLTDPLSLAKVKEVMENNQQKLQADLDAQLPSPDLLKVLTKSAIPASTSGELEIIETSEKQGDSVGSPQEPPQFLKPPHKFSSKAYKAAYAEQQAKLTETAQVTQ